MRFCIVLSLRILHIRFRDFPENTTQTESNENRNDHPYLVKCDNNRIYFYETTTTIMFNFTKPAMKSEQTGSMTFKFSRRNTHNATFSTLLKYVLLNFV